MYKRQVYTHDPRLMEKLELLAKKHSDQITTGWRVPAPAAFEQASFSRTGTSRNNVYYLRSRTGTSVTYPLGGYFTRCV